MNEKNQLEAEFRGGIFNGKIIPLSEAYPKVIHFIEVVAKTGETLRQQRDTYHLVSKEPTLVYEIENSN